MLYWVSVAHWSSPYQNKRRKAISKLHEYLKVGHRGRYHKFARMLGLLGNPSVVYGPADALVFEW